MKHTKILLWAAMHHPSFAHHPLIHHAYTQGFDWSVKMGSFGLRVKFTYPVLGVWIPYEFRYGYANQNGCTDEKFYDDIPF